MADLQHALGGAKTLDAQAGYESATTLMATVMSGANYIWHSAGWNEAGMHCSMAKFVVDAEQCAMAYRMAEGIRNGTISTRRCGRCATSARAGITWAIRTRWKTSSARYFMPELFDNNSIEQWQAEGAVETPERARAHARQLLKDYEEPHLDPAKDEALREYIARREREIPAADALNQDH